MGTARLRRRPGRRGRRLDARRRPPATADRTERPADTPAEAPAAIIGDQAAGAAEAGRILGAATTARWPMYVRNVKQIFRAAGGFDERRFGFGGLIDLLRACQRDGFIRLERDRRGGLRVFQGPALVKSAGPASGELHTRRDGRRGSARHRPGNTVGDGSVGESRQHRPRADSTYGSDTCLRGGWRR